MAGSGPGPAVQRLGFVTWADERPTGGNAYNAALVSALRELGTAVTVHRVPGHWPDPDPGDLGRLATVLRAGRPLLLDGIVASGAPEVVAAAVAAGREVTILVHMPSADEIGLAPDDRERRSQAERRAVQAASGVLAPSGWAAATLARRYGRVDVGLARAGVARGPLATGSGSDVPRLLTVAALTPTKDQLTLVRALALVGDLDWTARLVGPTEVDPAYVARVRDEVETAGLARRVRLVGTRVGPALETEWAGADLSVLPSRTEAYGLVVTEAIARGIPAVVTAGTGAVEALAVGAAHADSAPGPAETPPGAAVPVGDPTALAVVLRRWLTDPDLRRRWRAAAIGRRDSLPGWRSTAEAVLAYLDRTRRPGPPGGSTPTGSPPGPGPTPPPVRSPSTG